MKYYIAGHQGMVGSALVRRLQSEPGAEILGRTRRELDLTSQAAVEAFFAQEKPDTAAAAAPSPLLTGANYAERSLACAH